MRIAGPAALGILSLVIAFSTAHACRYNVRDVGFVDLGRSPYLLAEIVDRESAPGGVPTDERIFDLLRDTNVQYARLTRGEAAERGLIPADAASPAPRCLLVSHGNHTLDLSDHITGDGVEVDDAIRAAIDSPLRQQLLQKLIDSHSLVLVVGAESEERDDAVEASDAAIEHAIAARELWDKPIGANPARMVLTDGQLRSDPVLAWALDLDGDAHDVQVAVLYGRGRRLGEVLRGTAIEVASIEQKLALVGRDCECELDRRQIENPMFPHRWSADLDLRATKSLGFDPGNPLVVNEVELIMARGSQAREGVPASVGRPEEDLWGYQEIDLSSIEMPAEKDSPAEAEVSYSSAEPAPVTSMVDDKSPSSGGSRAFWIAVLLVAAASLGGSLFVSLRRG